MKSRLVAEIDENVKERAQIYAVQNRTTLADIAEKALVYYLDRPDENNDSEVEIN